MEKNLISWKSNSIIKEVTWPIFWKLLLNGKMNSVIQDRFFKGVTMEICSRFNIYPLYVISAAHFRFSRKKTVTDVHMTQKVRT